MKETIFYILIFCSTALMSQDFSKDMTKVYENYKSLSKIGFTIKYVLHENYNPNSRIISTIDGLYAKKENKTLVKYDNLITLTNNEKIITVDKSEKHIRIKNISKNTTIETMPFMSDFKKYEKSINKIVLLKNSDANVLNYSVELKKNPMINISKYEISIDKKNNCILKMSLFYITMLEKDYDYGIVGTEIPRLDILFSGFNDKKIMNDLEFNDTYYYTKSNGKLTPSSNYKNYDIKYNS